MSSKFQNVMLIGIAVVVIALFLRRPEKQIPIVQDIQITQPENSFIKINSEGVVQVAPDTAEVEIVITTEELALAEAKQKNEELTEEAIRILKEYQIQDKDINGDFLRVQVNAGVTQIYNHTVSNVIEVTIHDLSLLEPVLTSLQQDGKAALKISKVTFSLSRINQYEEQALQLAVDAAQEKAKAMSRKLGRQLGNVITIEQSTFNSSSLDSGTFTWMPGYRQDTLLSIAFTEITIRVYVTVKFELE